MAEFGSLIDTGDKVASIVGAVAGLVGLWVAARAGARLRQRRGLDPRLGALLTAQIADAGRHRYRFFGEHVPALSDLYVRSRATLDHPDEGEKPRTVQAAQILTAHHHAVLLGDAGAGKSTFLATIAADLARRARSRRGRGDIAVIVPASDLVGRRLPDATYSLMESRYCQRLAAVSSLLIGSPTSTRSADTSYYEPSPSTPTMWCDHGSPTPSTTAAANWIQPCGCHLLSTQCQRRNVR